MIDRVLSSIPNYIYVEQVLLVIMISVFVMLILLAILKNKRDTILCIGGVVLIASWFVIVLLCTIVGRNPSSFQQIELCPFWCVMEAWSGQNYYYWYLIVGNILLFIPIGVILPLAFKKMQKYIITVLVGLSFSLLVELTQLVLHLGLCEVDDLIHNTLGCALGYGFYAIVKWCIYRDRKKSEVFVASFLWLFVIAFLYVALMMGQPVFGYFM